MKYKLALELKNAGFPQKAAPSGNVTGLCKHGNWGFSLIRESCDCTPDDTCHIPTLEELIEACGDRLESLVNLHDMLHDMNKWIAAASIVSGEGTTSTEAVARLWLTLNKKN